jgi:hypothetical protein
LVNTINHANNLIKLIFFVVIGLIEKPPAVKWVVFYLLQKNKTTDNEGKGIKIPLEFAGVFLCNALTLIHLNDILLI